MIAPDVNQVGLSIVSDRMIYSAEAHILPV